MARISFFKLHGAGNDLIVLQGREMPRSGKAEFVRRVAHRQLGVGCDQVIEVVARRPLAIQIWNRDGSKAEMCANGARTFLFLAAHQNWIPRKAREVPIRISGKDYVGRRTTPGNYELCLGEPEVGAPETLKLGKEIIPFWPVKTGNPHAVIFVGRGPGEWRAPKDFSYLKYGPAIEHHPRFPARTNVEFVRRVRKGKTLRLDVEAWERGSGATLSCGSGAVAVAAVARQLRGGARVEVTMTSFRLRVVFEGHRAFLSGPCKLVAQGWIER